jgi:hypothetical protein
MNLVILDKTTKATPTSKINKINIVIIVIYCFSGFFCNKNIIFEDKDHSN